MSPAEYERYVAEVVKQINIGPGTTISLNERVPGQRQPGSYEIDIAVRAALGGSIEFFLIVECKNWSRPVDRPVVQKLVQTRDAIAAHKAAIASPVGFTQEAIDVAKVNGVALWVMSATSWSIIMGMFGPRRESWIDFQHRMQFLERLGLQRHPEKDVLRGPALISVDAADSQVGEDSADWQDRFHHCSSGGSAVTDGDNLPGIDPRHASTVLIDAIAATLGLPISPGSRSQ